MPVIVRQVLRDALAGRMFWTSLTWWHARTRMCMDRLVPDAGAGDPARAGREDPFRLSQISITRAADLIRDSASFRGPLSPSSDPAAGARARDQRPALQETSSLDDPGPAGIKTGPGSLAECRTATLMGSVASR
jgi:hypothetical protein